VKFITDNILLIVIAVVSGAALLIPILQRRGAKLSALQATQLMNQGKTLILDVRSTEEFATGHLQNAVNIPLNNLKERLKEIEKSKKQQVIVLCESGIRSATASALLMNNGFETVASLNGGIAEWKSQGLPTFK
jgi:rhodanese-related sulfurtransferase